MAFDWKRFLDDHGIRYITKGANVGRGNVNVRCPFCGSADQSEHMGISLRGKGWGCRRNVLHRGKSRARLIEVLLGCSREEAHRLAYGDSVVLPSDQELGAQLRSKLLGRGQVTAPSRKLTIPKEFKPLDSSSRFAEQFRDYLVSRGYSRSQVMELAARHELYYCTRGLVGYWTKYRIIMPIRDRDNKLWSWTGRSILPDEELRYKALRVWRDDGSVKDDGGPWALCSSRDRLFAEPLLWHCSDPKVLVVCEGPFDAMRINTFGPTFGVYATCLFGLSISESQIELLAELNDRFRRSVLVLDSAAVLQSLRLAGRTYGLDIERMPSDVKDPGDMTASQVIRFVTKLAS